MRLPPCKVLRGELLGIRSTTYFSEEMPYPFRSTFPASNESTEWSVRIAFWKVVTADWAKPTRALDLNGALGGSPPLFKTLHKQTLSTKVDFQLRTSTSSLHPQALKEDLSDTTVGDRRPPRIRCDYE